MFYSFLIKIEEWKSEFKGHSIWSHGSNNARGCAILSKSHELKELFVCNQGRLAVGSCDIPNIGEVCLVSIYAPTSDHRSDQLKFLYYLIDKLENIDLPIIMGGDVNVFFSKLDYKGKSKIKHNLLNCSAVMTQPRL